MQRRFLPNAKVRKAPVLAVLLAVNILRILPSLIWGWQLLGEDICLFTVQLALLLSSTGKEHWRLQGKLLGAAAVKERTAYALIFAMMYLTVAHHLEADIFPQLIVSCICPPLILLCLSWIAFQSKYQRIPKVDYLIKFPWFVGDVRLVFWAVGAVLVLFFIIMIVVTWIDPMWITLWLAGLPGMWVMIRNMIIEYKMHVKRYGVKKR